MKRLFETKISFILLLTLLLIAIGTFSACNNEKTNPEKVEVSFETDGGTKYFSIRALEDDTITLPTPEKEGYEFLGWYDNRDFSGEALKEEYIIDGNVTLYARWNPYSGVIKFESNGGTSYNDLSFNAQKVSIPTPTREGYLFDGWYKSDDFAGEVVSGTIIPTSDMTLYAKWSAIIGSVAFDSNGGTKYDTIYTSGQKIALPTPINDVYAFAGWYDNAELSGTAYFDYYLPDGAVTLYARWATEFITISLEENGGDSLNDVKLFDADALKLPKPFRSGYSFMGWYLNENLTGEPVSDYYYRPTEDVTLYAKWKDCTYLYLFYGDNKMEHVRYEYFEGDVLTPEFLNSLFVPDDIVVEDSLGFEHNIPFECWGVEDPNELTPNMSVSKLDRNYVELTENIVVGDTSIVLVAIYDDDAIPGKEYLTYDPNTGVYTTTGKVAHEFMKATEGTPYTYSLDMTFRKSYSGGVGAAFRMDVTNEDYHYENGCEYLAVTFVPAGGYLVINSVYDGSWSSLKQIDFSVLPQNWKDKYNGTSSTEDINVTMTIVDYGTYFEVYIDNELAYTYSDADVLAKFTATGVGVRSSANSTKLSNVKLSYDCDALFESNEN